MSVRTFVGDGASHNWSATGAWVEGIVPTAADDVVFSSNTLGSILVIDGSAASPSLCRSIDTTGYTRAINPSTSVRVLQVGTSTAGNFKFTVGISITNPFNIGLKFVSTTTGNLITSGGYHFGNITFDGVGGGWQLQDALDAGQAGAISTITLTNGSLDTNGQAVGSTVGCVLSSSNSNTRSLTHGSTTWTTPNQVGTVWDLGTTTGLTFSGGSSTIVCKTAGSGANSIFNGGGLVYGTLSCTNLSVGSLKITGSNSFTNLTLSTAAAQAIITAGFIFSADQIVTGTLTSNGAAIGQRSFIYSDTQGTQRTLTAAAVSMSNVDFRDIKGAGAANWDLSNITGGSGDCGGNSGITFNAPKSCFLKTAVNVVYSTSSGSWFTSSGGSTQITPAIPMVQDMAYIDGNSFTTSGKTLTHNVPRASYEDYTGVTNSPVINLNNGSEVEYYGSIILSSGISSVSISGSGGAPLTFSGRGNFVFKQAGLAWQNGGSLILSAYGGKITQADNASLSGALTTLTITSGTWDNDSLTTTIGGNLLVNGGTLNVKGTVSPAGTYTLSSGIVNLSAQLNGSSSLTLSGGVTNNTATAGEYKGTTFSCTGGTHTIRKLTLSSTFAQSAGTIIIPVAGNGTWATSWTWTGTTFVFTANGPITWSAGAYLVGANSSGGSWLSC